MSQINNPFIIKGAIPSHYFCDREEEINNWYTHPAFTFGDDDLSGRPDCR